jgi:hypothetical protein
MMKLVLGIARVSRALVGVPPTRPSAQQTHHLVRSLALNAIGGTPMAATETVALPIFNCIVPA